jgi:ceramide glucosyltransferase
VATALAAVNPGRVQVLRFGAAPATSNPKVFKLARALEPGDGLVAVLDDDTVLPRGALARAAAALTGGDLVTGLPHYLPGAGAWSKLVAGFVNGSALITYLPMLAAGPPVTINGMFYLTSQPALATAGGFGAIEGYVCDDYELALRFRRTGQRLVQAAIAHQVRTTVPDAAAYRRLMQRWMVFTGRQVRAELNLPIVVLLVLPVVLPHLALLLAAAARSLPLAVGVLVAMTAKATTMAVVRQRLLGSAESGAAVGWEVLADLLQPVHAIAALLRPGRIVWRTRHLRLDRSGRVQP